MPYLLRYGDIEFGSHFEKWPSPRYAQFLKFPPSRILKPYVYITQINSQTSIPPKCLRAYRAGPGLIIANVRTDQAVWFEYPQQLLIWFHSPSLSTILFSTPLTHMNLVILCWTSTATHKQLLTKTVMNH